MRPAVNSILKVLIRMGNLYLTGADLLYLKLTKAYHYFHF